MFENGGLTRDYKHFFMNRPDDEGLSHNQRREMARKEAADKEERKIEAMILREIESAPMPCLHEPDCIGDECKDMIEVRRKAEEKFQNTMAIIEPMKVLGGKDSVGSKGPSNTLSKHAAAALSQPKPVVSNLASKGLKSKARLPFSQISNRKQANAPSNPSPMRHTAATVTSKNTMGYSKGRVASASIRNARIFKNPKNAGDDKMPDTSISPDVFLERYGVPKLGRNMHIRCKNADFLREEDRTDEIRGAERLEALWREQAEEEFEFTL